mmetsp:Transcript_13832/g.36273  ORF Transcript_13832/g.36273 Transcript_13832/m.36273 type:complete len:204 (+) Transcript_13832:3-614(+)
MRGYLLRLGDNLHRVVDVSVLQVLRQPVDRLLDASVGRLREGLLRAELGEAHLDQLLDRLLGDDRRPLGRSLALWLLAGGAQQHVLLRFDLAADGRSPRLLLLERRLQVGNRLLGPRDRLGHAALVEVHLLLVEADLLGLLALPHLLLQRNLREIAHAGVLAVLLRVRLGEEELPGLLAANHHLAHLGRHVGARGGARLGLAL